ncbi:MAG: peptidoglycan DD-metalloendopeptidase family protein [Desulfatitalea sp.]
MNYRRIIAVALICLVLRAGPALAAETATVLASNLNVHSGPGESHGVVFKLAEKSRVRVLARSDGWLKIEYNGRQGYIVDSTRFVRLKEVAPAKPEVPSPPPTKEPEQTQLKDLQREAEELEEKLKASQSQLERMTQKERGVLNEVNATEQALDSARRQVREARAEMDTLQHKVEEIQQRYTLFEKEIRSGEAYAAQRLVALYKLNFMGRVQLLATANSFFDFVNRKSALERILSQDEAVLDKLRGDQAALETLLEQLNASRVQKRASEIALNQRIGALAAEQERRSVLLRKIRGEQELERAALLALRQAAQELDSTIEGLEPAVPARVPEKRPAPSTQQTAQAAPAPATPENLAFESHKGLLDWPVKGKIVSVFGPYTDRKSNLVNFQSGINIQAERGEPIRAVADGYTIFANWFKGFGNMLIVDHGNHYYTVYAHLEELFKVKGDRVEKGEVIATVGDSGSLSGPALHFEVRHHGKPIDPLKWINKG